MSGVEFFRRIRSSPCGKLLLTGKAGDDTAVQAFNEGLIDTFLVKQDARLSERLPDELQKLSERYFTRLSAALDPLTKRGAGRFLSDASFAEQLQTHPVWHGVSEHYLMLDPPGLRLETSRGGARLLVYDQETMRAQLEAAIAENAPAALVEQLAAKQSLLHFPTPGGFFTGEYASRWASYTSTAVRIEGQEPWWVAKIPMPIMNGHTGALPETRLPGVNQ